MRRRYRRAVDIQTETRSRLTIAAHLEPMEAITQRVWRVRPGAIAVDMDTTRSSITLVDKHQAARGSRAMESRLRVARAAEEIHGMPCMVCHGGNRQLHLRRGIRRVDIDDEGVAKHMVSRHPDDSMDTLAQGTRRRKRPTAVCRGLHLAKHRVANAEVDPFRQ